MCISDREEGAWGGGEVRPGERRGTWRAAEGERLAHRGRGAGQRGQDGGEDDAFDSLAHEQVEGGQGTVLRLRRGVRVVER
eukprot:6968047-Prymnesium_polylepis.1